MLFKKSLLRLGLFVTAFFLFTQCEELPEIDPLRRVQAKTHVLNLLPPDQVDVFLETGGVEVPFGKKLPFGGGYPENGYASLVTRTEVGTSPDSQRAPVYIRALDSYSRQPVLDGALFFLSPDIHTTVAMVDSFGKSKVVRAADTYPGFGADTTAMLRFMNLAYHLPSVSLRSGDSEINIDRLNFLTYSSFREVPARTYTLGVYEDASGFSVSYLPPTELVPGRYYNVWFTWRKGNSVVGIEELRID